MSVKKDYYKKLAGTVIKGLTKRHMEGHYCETVEEAKELAMALVAGGSSAAWGGSVTLDEVGILDALRERTDVTVLDRSKATSPEETKRIFHDSLSS